MGLDVNPNTDELTFLYSTVLNSPVGADVQGDEDEKMPFGKDIESLWG